MNIRNPSLSRFFLILTWAISCCLAQIASAQTPPAIRWVCSTPDAPWQELPATVQPQTPVTESNALRLDPATAYQTIDGFGGCFNELGWQALQTLDDAGQEANLLRISEIIPVLDERPIAVEQNERLLRLSFHAVPGPGRARP